MQVKRLSDILNELRDRTVARTDEVNDFTPGSVIQSIYEAIAMELESYYMLQEENINWGIERGVLTSFNFDRREATRAYGDVELTFYGPLSSDIVIPKGTQFSSSNYQYTQTYELQQSYLIHKGATSATVQVYCTEPGAVGNVDAGVIDSVSSSSSYASTVTNPNAILTGTDEESLVEVRKRFRQFIETLGRGTTRAMDYAARTIPEITGVYVKEDVGNITVYCHDANGELPDNLRQDVMKAEESYRPAGIPWDVEPVDKITQSLDLGVTVTDLTADTDTLTANLEAYVANYLNQFTVGQDVVVADLYSRIMSYSPLIYDVYITDPNNDDNTETHIDEDGNATVEVKQMSNVKVDSNEIIRAGIVSAYVVGA